MVHWGITPEQWCQCSYWEKVYMVEYYVAAKQRARAAEQSHQSTGAGGMGQALSQTPQL